MDGHFVTGHIDGVGKIARWERSGRDHVLDISAPAGRYALHCPQRLGGGGRNQPDGGSGAGEEFPHLDYSAHPGGDGVARAADGRRG